MEAAIIKYNQQHFAQAEGFPPTIPPLSDILGDGHSTHCDEILNGTYKPTHLVPHHIRQYISEMKRHNKPSPTPATIPTEKIIEGFKKWREKTSTSPSGVHLGHYKVLLVQDGTNYSPQDPDPANYIWSIITLIINASISIKRGPDSWEHVHQLIMQKKAGDNRLHRTRNINQYEAPYNLVKKYHWPKTTQHQEDQAGTLGECQFGGRKEKRANDVAFLNEMILEYHRMSYIPLGITQHDNTECFDRTVNNITTLSNRKFNVPDDICKLVSMTRKNTKYTIVTKFGPSKHHYTHTKQTPIHGSGQGSGNAGTEWNFLSIPVLNLMDKHTEGCTITGPDGTTWKKYTSLCRRYP